MKLGTYQRATSEMQLDRLVAESLHRYKVWTYTFHAA